MTAISDIIVAAYREGNLRNEGAPLTDGERAEGLSRLNSWLASLFGSEIGEQLYDWQVPAPTSAVGWPDALYKVCADPTRPPPQSRIVNGVTTDTTIYLPQCPNDGSRIGYVDVGASAAVTIDRNGRLIDGAADNVTLDPGSSPRIWFYRADLGSWNTVTSLTQESESPLPVEFDDLLITGLYIRLSSRTGVPVTEGTANTYREMLRKVRGRYKQPTPTPGGVPVTMQTEQSYDGVFWEDNLLQ